MAELESSDSVPCPSCEGGAMRVHAGAETARMLRCSACGEYYYRVGAVACIGRNFPKDPERADALLDALSGQPLRPEVAQVLRDTRARLGLPPEDEDADDDA